MSQTNLVQAKPEDLRSNMPSLTGNFIIAGEPKVFPTKTGKYKYSFSIMTSKYDKDKGTNYDAIFFNCYLFCNDATELEKVKKELARKAKVHVANSIPEANKWTDKNGEEKDYGVQYKVTAYYPFHLDKNLQKREFSGNSEAVAAATEQSSSKSAGVF